MSTQLDPLKTTAQDLHRFWFKIATVEQWYTIMRECRIWFGRGWQCQGKVKRKLSNRASWGGRRDPLWVWFDVPDAKFATWISVKLSLEVESDTKRKSDK